jgi:hypothetical protein
VFACISVYTYIYYFLLKVTITHITSCIDLDSLNNKTTLHTFYVYKIPPPPPLTQCKALTRYIYGHSVTPNYVTRSPVLSSATHRDYKLANNRKRWGKTTFFSIFLQTKEPSYEYGFFFDVHVTVHRNMTSM